MIQQQTYLNVADNSGARQLMCLRVLGTGNCRYGRIGGSNHRCREGGDSQYAD